MLDHDLIGVPDGIPKFGDPIPPPPPNPIVLPPNAPNHPDLAALCKDPLPVAPGLVPMRSLHSSLPDVNPADAIEDYSYSGDDEDGNHIQKRYRRNQSRNPARRWKIQWRASPFKKLRHGRLLPSGRHQALNMPYQGEYEYDEFDDDGFGICRTRFRVHIRPFARNTELKQIIRQQNINIVHQGHQQRDDSGDEEYSDVEWVGRKRFRKRYRVHVRHNPRNTTKQLILRVRQTHDPIPQVARGIHHPLYVPAPMIGGLMLAPFRVNDYEYDEYSDDEGIAKYHTTYCVRFDPVNLGNCWKKYRDQWLCAPSRPSRPVVPLSRPQPPRIEQQHNNVYKALLKHDGIIHTIKQAPLEFRTQIERQVHELLQQNLWGDEANNRMVIQDCINNHAQDQMEIGGLTARVVFVENDLGIHRNELDQHQQDIQRLEVDLQQADNRLTIDQRTETRRINAELQSLRDSVNRLVTNANAHEYHLLNLEAKLLNLTKIFGEVDHYLSQLLGHAHPLQARNINFEQLPFQAGLVNYQAHPGNPLVANRGIQRFNTHNWNQLQQFYQAYP